MKLKKWVRYLRKSREAWSVLSEQFGWKRSFIEGRPLDGEGQPIPWYTYSAIEFIRSLNLVDCRVFEYGCGNSSMFWAARSREVFAVENDAEWARVVRGFAVSHLTVIEATAKDQYINAPLDVGGTFNIIVIDGRFRRDCAAMACRVISDGGLIIFDNADWYPDACADLRTRGWFQIDFSGLGPINPYAWTTAVFLKSNVVFERQAGVQPIGGNPSGAV